MRALFRRLSKNVFGLFALTLLIAGAIGLVVGGATLLWSFYYISTHTDGGQTPLLAFFFGPMAMVIAWPLAFLGLFYKALKLPIWQIFVYVLLWIFPIYWSISLLKSLLAGGSS